MRFLWNPSGTLGNVSAGPPSFLSCIILASSNLKSSSYSSSPCFWLYMSKSVSTLPKVLCLTFPKMPIPIGQNFIGFPVDILSCHLFWGGREVLLIFFNYWKSTESFWTDSFAKWQVLELQNHSSLMVEISKSPGKPGEVNKWLLANLAFSLFSHFSDCLTDVLFQRTLKAKPLIDLAPYSEQYYNQIPLSCYSQ